MVKVRKFLDEWTDDALGTKLVFISLLQDLREKDEAGFEFYVGRLLF